MSDPTQPNWKWFPPVKTDWSLDVVNLLVVIGEQSMIEHAQPITASFLCALPRLIPAPQVFLKAVRPARMPDVSAKMTGVYSGITLDSVGFFANIIHPLDELPAFSFQVLDIRHADKCLAEKTARPNAAGAVGRRAGWLARVMSKVVPSSKREPSKSSVLCGRPPRDEETASQEPSEARATARDSASSPPTSGNNDSHKKPLQCRKSTRERLQDYLSHPPMAASGERPAVPPRLFSPIHILGVLSFLVSIAIVVCAVLWEDGNAIIAVTLLSLMSSLVGFASFWRPLLTPRRHTNQVPRGDIIIRTREGAFLLVRCTEDVARELYSTTEECDYHVGNRAHRMLMALGTVLLMLGVILLGNCTWNSQVFIGASYIILNGLYWGLGMLPRSYLWDLSRYWCKDITPPDAKNANKPQGGGGGGHPSYTRTMWYAIRETRRTGWVQISGAAPNTEQWRRWLAEAEKNARDGNREWKAVERKNEIMNVRTGGAQQEDEDEYEDQAMSCAPASQVAPKAAQGNRASFF
ncbi:hypothetical protein ACRE_030860 [Hapsidospora chrysogenum ATCC 11550]|uniref:Uncharacterized protein n=1 Tax=Hapsidospora chrysogenum (strain ATCC 11550 / CBS 779.69 / DSM 880 / IAM 14645 / JCM 23072 / IMI 49137) TaxID=857340 RepID=A0A086T9Q7_HAPC1|nr:hypothetical protein ACRE_030860 [Hapsidospora chrysogenum ATCC 11550]